MTVAGRVLAEHRQFAVELTGTRITFECALAGHRYAIDFGPDAPRKQRIATALLPRFTRYWSRENGGCTGVCPKCKRAARIAAKGEQCE